MTRTAIKGVLTLSAFFTLLFCLGVGGPSTRETLSIRAAINVDNLEALRQALNAGADPNLLDEYELPPLVYAVNSGSEAIVLELLSKGAKADPARAARSPLEAAFEARHPNAGIACNVKLVTILLEHGADANGAFPTSGERPVQRALELGDVACLNVVTKFGGDWRVTSPRGKSALEAALQGASTTNNPLLIDRVIALGADVNGTVSRRGGPLIQAIGDHNVPAIKQLLALGADPCLRGGKYGLSPWVVAIGTRRRDIVDLLAPYHCTL